jgi:hypothetical protein
MIHALLELSVNVVEDQYDNVSRKGISSRITGLYLVLSRSVSNSTRLGMRQSFFPLSRSVSAYSFPSCQVILPGDSLCHSRPVLGSSHVGVSFVLEFNLRFTLSICPTTIPPGFLLGLEVPKDYVGEILHKHTLKLVDPIAGSRVS